MRKYIYLVFFISCGYLSAFAQVNDSLLKKSTKLVFGFEDDFELQGTQITTKIDSLLHPEFRISGYVSTYYAFYDDDIEVNNFVQFPTLAPRKDQFSLNMALLSFEYKSESLRAVVALHYGDVPVSSWPATFNLIQEAHAGIRLHKKLWFDAGFFKTHIGLESFQPRENITSSMSIPNFYDPYFLSGAKLTFLATPKLNLQVCMFNGYNEYIDNNKNKALDFSMNYNPNKRLSFTYNFLTCDETPDNVKTKHQRYYQNFYATYIHKKITVGFDVNFGLQENTLKSDTTKMASMYGAILVGKYQFIDQISAYGRLENYSDPNQILATNVDIGENIKGFTIGMEFNPQKTVSFSAEWRQLQADNLIFKQGNTFLNQRNEFIVCLDLWF